MSFFFERGAIRLGPWRRLHLPVMSLRIPYALLIAFLLVGCDTASTSETRARKSGPSGTKPATTTAAAGPTAPDDGPAGTEDALADVLQLTSGFAKAGEAYFSSDTNWIIFQATPKGQEHYQMYVAPLKKQGSDITGLGRPVQISPDGSMNTCGYFSPDGQSILFASTADRKLPDAPPAGYQRQGGGGYRWAFPDAMEMYRADGWRQKLPPAASAGEPSAPAAAVNLATTPITKNDAYDAEGAYSPDGKLIVFSSRRDGDSELYVMRPDGTGAVRLTNVKGYDGGPFFAPDGRRIVYRSDRKGNDLLQVFVADLAFDDAGNVTGIKNEKQLTNDANVNWGPYFHPDGRHIIYATSAHGHHNYELYLMRDDGSHKTRVTHKAGFDGLPVFSPDGRYLMWSSKRAPDNTTQVFITKFLPPEGW